MKQNLGNMPRFVSKYLYVKNILFYIIISIIIGDNIEQVFEAIFYTR